MNNKNLHEFLRGLLRVERCWRENVLPLIYPNTKKPLISQRLSYSNRLLLEISGVPYRI